MAEVHRISLPEYQVDRVPDFENVGQKIDNFLYQRFPEQRVVMRGISASVHTLPIDDLIEKIIKLGTDRFDATRVGIGYDRSPCDFFAVEFTLRSGKSMGKHYVRKLYEEPQNTGLSPQRLDVLMVYDPAQVSMCPYKIRADASVKKDAFNFVNPEKKAEALKAVVRID